MKNMGLCLYIICKCPLGGIHKKWRTLFIPGEYLVLVSGSSGVGGLIEVLSIVSKKSLSAATEIV